MISKKYKKIGFYSLAFFTISVLAVNQYIKSITQKHIYTSEKEIPAAKVGIIFGAGINGNNPSKYLKDRLDAGIHLYNTKKIQKILKPDPNRKKLKKNAQNFKDKKFP